jgi:AbrB family looped-hinge helix DNA binding protein
LKIEVAIDKQGRIVIPKEIREKYSLSENSKLELIARECTIELTPLTEEDDIAVRSLKEPCKTGNPKAHNKAFSRNRAWKR